MAELVGQPWLETVRFEPGGDGAVVETNDVRSLYRLLPQVAKRLQIRLFEISALDESLSSVFAYVTAR
jgi:hypothetical protein